MIFVWVQKAADGSVCKLWHHCMTTYWNFHLATLYLACTKTTAPFSFVIDMSSCRHRECVTLQSVRFSLIDRRTSFFVSHRCIDFRKVSDPPIDGEIDLYFSWGKTWNCTTQPDVCLIYSHSVCICADSEGQCVYAFSLKCFSRCFLRWRKAMQCIVKTNVLFLSFLSFHQHRFQHEATQLLFQSE